MTGNIIVLEYRSYACLYYIYKLGTVPTQYDKVVTTFGAANNELINELINLAN